MQLKSCLSPSFIYTIETAQEAQWHQFVHDGFLNISSDFFKTELLQR